MDSTVKEFVNELKKNFSLEWVILFGSRARGDCLKKSDYDFIIVSKDFSGTPFVDRMKEVILRCNAFFLLLTFFAILLKSLRQRKDRLA